MPCLVKRCKTLDKPLNSGCHIEDLFYLSILGETIGFCLTSYSLAERKVGVTDKGTKFVSVTSLLQQLPLLNCSESLQYLKYAAEREKPIELKIKS